MIKSHAAAIARLVVGCVLCTSVEATAQLSDPEEQGGAETQSPQFEAETPPATESAPADNATRIVETIPVEPLRAERAEPEPKAEEDATRIGDIVVTAQKRAQPIYDVPVSVTAFSGDDLEKMGMESLRDIAAATPSFSVVEAGPGAQHLQMRGISSAFGQATVGYQLDNVTLTSFSLTQPDAATFDLASVEILRGPQGTLYGEGSMGGTIKLLTQKPRTGEWEIVGKGDAFLSDGADPGVQGDLAVNVPIGDTLAARVVGSVADLGGYIDEVELDQDNYNYQTKKNGRVRAQWEPLGDLTIGAMALYQSIDAGSPNAADDNYERHDSNEIGISDHGHIYSADISWIPEWFNVFWTGSLMQRDNALIFDGRDVVIGAASGGNPTLAALLSPLVRSAPGGYTVENDSKMTELRLSSAPGDALIWTVGVYARKYDQVLHLDTDVNVAADFLDLQLPGLPLPLPLPNDPGAPIVSVPLIDTTTISHSMSTSLFGQLEYDWTDWLNTAIGARYFREKLDVASSGQAAAQDATSDDHLNFRAFTPRAVVSMRAPDRLFSFVDTTLFYLSYAEGFRSGGANIQVAADIPPTYEPDKLKTVEAGTKLQLWDGLVTAEFALYYNRWVDVQVIVYPSSSSAFTAIQNEGDAEGRGVDWNLVFAPTRSLKIYHSGGYIDTYFVKGGATKNKGDPIDFVAPFTAALGASLGFTWPSGFPGSIRADYSYAGVSHYQSRSQSALNNTLTGSTGSDYVSDPAHMLGARLSLQTENAEFALYGRNLLDNEGAMDANQPDLQSRARPPSYGVEMKVTF